MMMLAMNPVQSWTTVGSLLFIVGALVWLGLIAGTEAARSFNAAKRGATEADATEEVEDQGTNLQTSEMPVTPESVLAALVTLDDPRETYSKPNARSTAAATLPVRRPLRAVAQPAKRPHLRVVPPLVSATRRQDRVSTKVYDWSRHGL